MMATTGYNQTGNDVEVVVGLNGLNHYPCIQRSKGRTAGIPPERSGYEVAYILTEPSRDSKVLVNFGVVVSKDNSTI